MWTPDGPTADPLAGRREVPRWYIRHPSPAAPEPYTTEEEIA